MKIKYFFTIIFLSFLLTSCYDYKEVNDIAIIDAISIDYSDNLYRVKVSVINPQAPSLTTITQAPFMVYSEEGKNLTEAFRKIANSTPRYLYANHLQLLIISDSIAQKDISKIVDFFLRNPTIRTEFYVAITNDINLIENITPVTELSATSLKESIEINSNNYGTTAIVTFNDLADMVLNPHKDVYLPVILKAEEKKDQDKIENTSSSTQTNIYNLNGISLFKDNKMITTLNNENSKYFNFLNNNIKNTIISYQCKKDEYLTLEILKNKTTITTKNKEIFINLKMNGNISENNCNIKLNKKDNLDLIENDLKIYIKNNLDKTMNLIKEKDTDPFGFIDLIYKLDHKTYKENKLSIKDLKININVNLTINEKGNVLEEINEQN